MAEYIEREAAQEEACNRCGQQGHCNRPELCPVMDSIKAIPAADVVARDCYERILVENDTMREQLAQIGKKPGDSMNDVRHVVRGKWIKMTGMMPPECTGHYECSLCGWHGRHSVKETEFSFCPNCGNMMEES